MKIRPNLPDGFFLEGFTEENDIFQMKPFGERLGNLVKRLEKPITIVLDGPWGSGKSTFAKQWTGHLKNEEKANVIYFDAFAHDFHENAFIALSRQISKLLSEAETASSLHREQFTSRAKAAASSLIPVAAKIGLRAATLGLLSNEDVQQLSETTKQLTMDSAGIIENYIGEAVEKKLQQANEDENALDKFRTALEEIAKAISGKENNTAEADRESWPLVFVVDELDRCKPTFALEILETIKHLFAVPGVAFVLVTHLPQLAAAVSGRYGRNVDGHKYLHKFYDLRFRMPDFVGKTTQIPPQKYLEYLWRELALGDENREANATLLSSLKVLVSEKNLQLRDVERVCKHTALYRASLSSGRMSVPVLAATLLVLRHDNLQLFTKIKQGAPCYTEIKNYLDWPSWNGKRMADRFMQWWTFCSAADLSVQDDQYRGFAELISSYNVEREEIASLTAQDIDALQLD